MFTKLRKILGVESEDERIQRLISVTKQIADLSKSINESADLFTERNEGFKSILKSNSVDEETKERIRIRHANLIKSQGDELREFIKVRNSLRQQHKKLMQDDKLMKAVTDLSFYENIQEKYKTNEINKSTYNLLLKAKQGKVKYADTVVYNEEGKILILQRTRVEDDKNGGKWVIPGGHVDAGEEFCEAAQRELKEESGISAEDINEIGLYEDENAEIHYFSTYVKEKETQVILQNGESESYLWIDVNDIDKYEMPFNMAENLTKILCPNKPEIIKIEKAIEEGRLSKEFGEDLIQKSKSILGEFGDEAVKKIGEALSKPKIEKGEDKVSVVMKEFAEGKLKSSSGQKVIDKKQALAIAYSEAGLSKSEIEEIEPIEKAYLNGRISEEVFEKARTGKYADNAENRRLKRVGQSYGSKKGEDTKEEKEGKKEPETDKKQGEEKSIEEHARSASEQSLINASKGGDEEHRKAAKAELDRREKEESPKGDNKEGDNKEETSPIDELNEKIEEELSNQDNPLNEANLKIEGELNKKENQYLDKFRTLSDEQVKFYLEAPYPEVKEAAKMVADERSLKVVSKDEYIKEFEDYSKKNNSEIVFPFYKDDAKKSKEYLEKNKDIFESVDEYKFDGFVFVRDYLSNEKLTKEHFSYQNGEKELKVDEDYVLNMVNNISKFIENNRINNNLSLHRRVLTGNTFFAKLKEGDIYEDKSFSSTSLKELTHFGDFNINILAKKGSSVANINNVGETEYIINRGSKFRVIERREDGLGITVELL